MLLSDIRFSKATSLGIREPTLKAAMVTYSDGCDARPGGDGETERDGGGEACGVERVESEGEGASAAGTVRRPLWSAARLALSRSSDTARAVASLFDLSSSAALAPGRLLGAFASVQMPSPAPLEKERVAAEAEVDGVVASGTIASSSTMPSEGEVGHGGETATAVGCSEVAVRGGRKAAAGGGAEAAAVERDEEGSGEGGEEATLGGSATGGSCSGAAGGGGEAAAPGCGCGGTKGSAGGTPSEVQSRMMRTLCCCSMAVCCWRTSPCFTSRAPCCSSMSPCFLSRSASCPMSVAAGAAAAAEGGSCCALRACQEKGGGLTAAGAVAAAECGGAEAAAGCSGCERLRMRHEKGCVEACAWWLRTGG